jgi:Ca2+/H+ antiporter, TMEM165/GDT1 family
MGALAASTVDVGFLLTAAAAAVAVGIEMLEALAIVLAVGMTRGFRDALAGALAAVVVVVLLCLVLGPALLGGADLDVLRVIVGTLLLLFGLEWMRKGILRMAGRRRRSSAYDEFIEERDALGGEHASGGGPDWAARLVAFKGVFLEGLEVGLIVLALGGTPGQLAPALLGTAVALALVAAIGLVLHEPLRRLPETQLKLGVGVALTSFGTFFTAEGLGVDWPLGDVALLYLAALFATTAWLAARRLVPAPLVAGAR